MVLSQSASNACCLCSTTCKRTGSHICLNDAVHGASHEAVETSAVPEQQPSAEPTEVSHKPNPTRADAPSAEAKAVEVLAELPPLEAEPVAADAEPAVTEAESALAGAEPTVAVAEPAVAEAEPAVARADPAVAQAEPAVAKGDPTDSMPEWASVSEEAISADRKQHDELQPPAAEHVIAEQCEAESPASDTAAADNVIHDTDTTDLMPEATLLEQDSEVDGVAGIHAHSEGKIHMWTSILLQ